MIGLTCTLSKLQAFRGIIWLEPGFTIILKSCACF